MGRQAPEVVRPRLAAAAHPNPMVRPRHPTGLHGSSHVGRRHATVRRDPQVRRDRRVHPGHGPVDRLRDRRVRQDRDPADRRVRLDRDPEEQDRRARPGHGSYFRAAVRRGRRAVRLGRCPGRRQAPPDAPGRRLLCRYQYLMLLRKEHRRRLLLRQVA